VEDYLPARDIDRRSCSSGVAGGLSGGAQNNLCMLRKKSN
jgi:hypothetical protein